MRAVTETQVKILKIVKIQVKVIERERKMTMREWRGRITVEMRRQAKFSVLHHLLLFLLEASSKISLS